MNESVEFDLSVTNNGSSDSFEFYNLLGFEMYPTEKIFIGPGETKDVHLTISPIGEFEHEGAYTLTYFIKGSNSETESELTFRSVYLEDAFEVGSVEFDSDSKVGQNIFPSG